jgi:hypothetical protein
VAGAEATGYGHQGSQSLGSQSRYSLYRFCRGDEDPVCSGSEGKLEADHAAGLPTLAHPHTGIQLRARAAHGSFTPTNFSSRTVPSSVSP